MSARESLETLWAQKGLDPASLALRSNGTLAASERHRLAESQTLASDPGEMMLRAHTLSPQRLTLGELLGRGGMGEVRVAEQVGLRRSVAVKTALDRTDAPQAAALLKEAWVGAALQHPSVVPVHTLAATESGPAIVMKRIEGRSWDASLSVTRDGEPRERDLRVFSRVCHAIAFAHSRGILHLDLKPENVMLGADGEVYVLDWGLAVSHGPDGPSWLPPAAAIQTIAGTPTCMAPELVAADGARIGPRTDVYLLGALLHHLICGRPLHEGDTMVEVLLAAWESRPPVYEGDVPRELVAIVHRATHRDPDQRFASAEELREAVEAHLRHRRSDRFARRALTKLLEIDGLLAKKGTGDVEIEPRIAEVELAIDRARRGWPEHPELDRLEQGLHERRFAQAIRSERPAVAAQVLARIRTKTAEREAELAALRARLDQRARHVERLEEMRRELDRTLGDRDRRRMFALFGIAWALVCFAFGALTRAGLLTIGYRELAIEGALLVLGLVPLAVVQRTRLLQNRANRRLWGGLALAAFTVELLLLAAWTIGMAPMHAIAATLFFYAYAFVTLGFVFDRRMALGAIPIGIGAALACTFPDFIHDAVGLGGGGAVAIVLFSGPRARP